MNTTCVPQPIQTSSPSATKLEAREALKLLTRFICPSQLSAITEAMVGEEQAFFFQKTVDLAATVTAMPKTYETDGLCFDATAHLHYFIGRCDWYLTELDLLPEQHQAFGLADMGCPELGYISIVELLGNGVELDLYWVPKTLKDIVGESQ